MAPTARAVWAWVIGGYLAAISSFAADRWLGVVKGRHEIS